ncbi:hypothetical protein TeGR_g11870, partial [Tetraparma gracilis]
MADDSVEESLDSLPPGPSPSRSRLERERARLRAGWCPHAHRTSVGRGEIEPREVRELMHPPAGAAGKGGGGEGDGYTEVPSPVLPGPPLCPKCRGPLLPQCLMFDESYASHDFYQLEVFRGWFEEATAFVFVGTSFAVTVTDLAIEEAKKRRVPVYNFNLEAGRIEPTATLDVENVVGRSEETLVELEKCLR